AVVLACLRVDRGGPRTARASTQVIQADDKELVGVDGLARPDAILPPAWLAVRRAVIARRMMIAAQGVADEHGVAAIRIQGAICLHHEIVTGNGLATAQWQRFIEMQA